MLVNLDVIYAHRRGVMLFRCWFYSSFSFISVVKITNFGIFMQLNRGLNWLWLESIVFAEKLKLISFRTTFPTGDYGAKYFQRRVCQFKSLLLCQRHSFYVICFNRYLLNHFQKYRSSIQKHPFRKFFCFSSVFSQSFVRKDISGWTLSRQHTRNRKPKNELHLNSIRYLETWRYQITQSH